MASSAKEGTWESSSAAGAEMLKASVGSECPICLGAVRRPAFVAYCMHQFCFSCIQQWAQDREDCPVCRQSLEQVLHSVRGDDDYKLFVVGLPTRLRRRMAMERARACRGHGPYDLRRRLAADPPAAGQREPMARRREPMARRSDHMARRSELMACRSEPLAGRSEPMAGRSEPMAGQSEPMAGRSEPMAGQSEPMAGRSEPMAGQSEPMAGRSEPMAGQSEPMASQSEPMAGWSEPMAGRSEPVDTESSQGQGAPPRPSRIPAQPAPVTSTSQDPSHRTGPGAPPDIQNGTE